MCFAKYDALSPFHLWLFVPVYFPFLDLDTFCFVSSDIGFSLFHGLHPFLKAPLLLFPLTGRVQEKHFLELMPFFIAHIAL